MLPAGAIACPEYPPDADRYSNDARHETHEHSHGPSDPGRGDHDHAAGPESQRGQGGELGVPGKPGAPLDAPTCCSRDTRAPVALASVLDTKPRPKSIAFAAPSPLLDVPQPVVLPSGARLRLRQPEPLPYARTRRPLLI